MAKNQMLEDSLGAYIGKAGKMMGKRLSDGFSEAGYDLRLDHWIVLVHLWIEDGWNQKSLCDMAGEHKTRITRTLDDLEQKSYVVRVPDQNDRRQKRVYLTHKGKEEREALTQIMQQMQKEATQGIPESELETCKSVLDRIFYNLAGDNHIQNSSYNSYKPD